MPLPRLRVASFLLGLLAIGLPSAAPAKVSDVPTTWRLLDYIAVDYRGAVADGKIISELEYN